MQSELHDLEGQLQQIDRDDAKDIGNVEAQKAAREWKHYADDTNSRAKLHRDMQAQIAGKIKAYRTPYVSQKRYERVIERFMRKQA